MSPEMWEAIAFGSSMVVVVARYLRRTVGQARERTRARNKLASITAIADVKSEGTVARVTGFVKPTSGLLTAPLSGLDCVAYRARADGRTQPLQMPVIRFEMRPFSVDGITVATDFAEFAIPPVPLFPSVEQRDRYDAFLGGLGLDRHHRIFSGGAAFDEVVVTEGMRVTVIGTVMHAGAEAGSHYRDLAHRWRLVGSKDHPVVIGEALD